MEDWKMKWENESWILKFWMLMRYTQWKNLWCTGFETNIQPLNDIYEMQQEKKKQIHTVLQ